MVGRLCWRRRPLKSKYKQTLQSGSQSRSFSSSKKDGQARNFRRICQELQSDDDDGPCSYLLGGALGGGGSYSCDDIVAVRLSSEGEQDAIGHRDESRRPGSMGPESLDEPNGTRLDAACITSGNSGGDRKPGHGMIGLQCHL